MDMYSQLNGDAVDLQSLSDAVAKAKQSCHNQFASDQQKLDQCLQMADAAGKAGTALGVILLVCCLCCCLIVGACIYGCARSNRSDEVYEKQAEGGVLEDMLNDTDGYHAV